MPVRCGGLTKKQTKCRICVKSPGERCRWHLPPETVQTCTICLADIEDDKKTLKHCGHTFHSECILPWFVRCGEIEDGSLTCPNCRDVVADPVTVAWVGEHTTVESERHSRRRRTWRRLAQAAAEQRVESRRGLLEHIRGLFDRLAGHVAED